MESYKMEQLKYLITNPYSWVLIGAVLILPYLLKYMRILYPETLRKKMEEEEACTLELYQKPQMRTMRKNMVFAIVISLISSYVLGYHLMESSNPLRTSKNIFVLLIVLIALYAIVVEYKITKGKSCKDVIVGYKYIKWLAIVEVTVLVVAVVIFGIMALLK